MDRRLRQLERKWIESGDVNIHAQILRHLLSIRKIENKHIILGGFVGVEACKLISDDVRHDGVIWRDQVYKNVEIKDYLNNLDIWGWHIGYRAALPILNMLLEAMPGYQYANKYRETLELAREFVNKGDKDSRENLSKIVKTLQLSQNEQPGANSYLHAVSRAWIFRRIVERMSRPRNCCYYLSSASIFFKDEEVKSAVRKEISSYLFKEYA